MPACTEHCSVLIVGGALHHDNGALQNRHRPLSLLHYRTCPRFFGFVARSFFQVRQNLHLKQNTEFFMFSCSSSFRSSLARRLAPTAAAAATCCPSTSSALSLAAARAASASHRRLNSTSTSSSSASSAGGRGLHQAASFRASNAARAGIVPGQGHKMSAMFELGDHVGSLEQALRVFWCVIDFFFSFLFYRLGSGQEKLCLQDLHGGTNLETNH